METRRLKLQGMLEEILGSRNVYFQPPESMKLNYPAIVYSRSPLTDIYANDRSYVRYHSFNVTLLDINPMSEYVEKILNIPFSSHVQNYKDNNLNHDVFKIYI